MRVYFYLLYRAFYRHDISTATLEFSLGGVLMVIQILGRSYTLLELHILHREVCWISYFLASVTSLLYGVFSDKVLGASFII